MISHELAEYLSRSPSWWINFIQHIVVLQGGQNAWDETWDEESEVVIAVALTEYGAYRDPPDPDNDCGRRMIHWKNDNDYTAFLLRWS